MVEERRIFKELDDAIESGRDVALVTVIDVKGSAPRDHGSRMLVFADGKIYATIGGGKLEALAIKEALKQIKKGESAKVVFDLTEKGIGMACSGRAEIFIEPFISNLNLLILGAGHVGLKVAQVASAAGVSCAVADDREEFANSGRFPKAKIYLKRPDLAVSKSTVDEKTHIVIVTRGHSLDKECLEAALKTKAAYIGMIGSRSKVGLLFKDLNRKGLYPQKDARVYSPIGLDIGGKSPGEIAVSIMSEIFKVANKRSGLHMKEKPYDGH